MYNERGIGVDRLYCGDPEEGMWPRVGRRPGGVGLLSGPPVAGQDAQMSVITVGAIGELIPVTCEKSEMEAQTNLKQNVVS